MRAIAVDDPTRAIAPGDAFRVGFALFPPADDGFGVLRDWREFNGALLSIMFERDGKWQAEGSAVMIGPGLALAARHVMEPNLPDLLSSKGKAVAVGIAEHGLLLWDVRHVSLHNSDAMILVLSLRSPMPPNRLITCVSLTTRLPLRGERVMIAGLRGGGAVSEVDNGLEYDLEGLLIGVGEVTEIYPEGRDRSVMPYPCVEVRCLTKGGMSGGPAFDARGRLIGVLSTSFEDEDGPSYVSLLFRVLGTPIESSWLEGIVKLPTTILEMAKEGLVSLEGADAMIYSGKGGDARLMYRAWS